MYWNYLKDLYLNKCLYFLIKYFQWGICFSRLSALGPMCWPSTLGLAAPGPIKFISAGFDFLPVCVIKCSCAILIKHMFEFSIHKRFYEKFLRINCMNMCNVQKKRILVLSNNKFSQGTVIVYKKAGEWYIEWQRVTTNDKKWQQMTMSGSEWQWYNDTVHFKEWVTAILSVTKTDALLPGMVGCN